MPFLATNASGSALLWAEFSVQESSASSAN